MVHGFEIRTVILVVERVGATIVLTVLSSVSHAAHDPRDLPAVHRF